MPLPMAATMPGLEERRRGEIHAAGGSGADRAQGAPGRRGGGAGVEEGGAFQIEGEAAGVFQALQGALVAGVAHGVDGAREQHLGRRPPNRRGPRGSVAG